MVDIDITAAKSTFRRFPANDPQILTEIGKKIGDVIEIDGGSGFALFGPYLDARAGPFIARIVFEGQGQGSAVADICAEHAELQLTSQRFDLSAIGGKTLELRTVLPRPLSACEVRLYCDGPLRANISAVEIESPVFEPYVLSSDLDRRLEYFQTYVAPGVEGWLSDQMYQVLKIIGPAFDRLGIYGNVAEIGIHHGLSFFLFTSLRRNDELAFAIDVFAQQRSNIDQSGMGSLTTFLSHLNLLLPLERPFVHVVQRDTLTFSMQEFTNIFSPNGVKLFSVDGGHTIAHVCNDLSLVQEVLLPGGIVALDDFFGPHWPTVTEGFYQFMKTRNRRLKPVLLYQNKLFLTTVSEHEFWLDSLRTGFEAIRGQDEMRSGHWKYVEISDSKTLSYG
jgi:hypothetical protein